MSDSPATSRAAGRTRRPTGVRVVVALTAVQAVLLVVLGVVLILERRDPEYLESFEARASTLLSAGVLLAALGATYAVFGLLLWRGTAWVRSLYGFLATAQIALAVYSLVALRDLRFGSLWAFALPVAVLWFLYGSEETQEFFAP